MQAFDTRCYPRLMNISYKDHIINEDVCRKIQAAIGKYNTPDLSHATDTKMVWPNLKVFWLNKKHSTGHSEGKEEKKRRKVNRRGDGKTILMS